MARFYGNENFPRPVVDELRRLGHDVLTIQETGRGNESLRDEEVLRLSTEAGRTLLTINRRDFIRLHSENPGHAGIVVCTLDLDFSGQAERIHTAVSSKPDLNAQLIRVNRPVRA